jgi:hypothetical protein
VLKKIRISSVSNTVDNRSFSNIFAISKKVIKIVFLPKHQQELVHEDTEAKNLALLSL